MVLFLHSRYRTTGGEERTVEDLMWVVREQLGEPAELLSRDPGEPPASLARVRAATGLLYGGLRPSEVAGAVRLSGARVLHAHNLLPTLGWRALAAARAAGARVVLHLHQYRLVCAVGVCFTAGAECTRCHGRDTLPGVRLNCRGSRAEALAYGASLALWQRRLVEQADAVVVPSEFARERLRELGAPLRWERVRVLAPPLRALADEPPASGAAREGRPPDERLSPAAGPSPSEIAPCGDGPFALVVSRLSPEKGVDVAIDACREAGMALVVAGEGPQRAALVERARGQRVRFVGQAGEAQLARLRAQAAIALVPSRSAESFGLAAAEALAAGLPVAASRVGALPELLGEEALVTPGDAGALAQAIARLAGDREAARRGLERVRALCAPRVIARALTDLYDGST
ncbi:MAG TPA: glycosyltransferase family 4 protein [Solirubrobacteraceae bacterium]|jgi:glycosyltransferase involved in cell wall biosynthesis|nr:glycosyltransferase family 4 protein [Solirubrobacteraceae bacterium]